MNNNLNTKGSYTFYKIYKYLTRLLSLFYVYIIAFMVFLLCFTVLYNNKHSTKAKSINNTVVNQKCIFVIGNHNKIQTNIINTYAQVTQNTNPNEIYPIFFENVPFLNSTTISEEYKKTYIKMLMPMVIEANNKVNKQRVEAVAIYNKSYYSTIDKEDIVKIKKLSNEYNVAINEESLWEYIKAINELILKIDSIPNSVYVSLLVGMSNWGKSPLVKKNALFYKIKGKYNTKPLPNILKDKDFTHNNYKNIEASVADLLLYINTSKDFKEFRETRYSLKNHGKHGDPLTLLSKVPPYILKTSSNIFKQNIIQYSLNQYNNINSTLNKKRVCVKVH